MRTCPHCGKSTAASSRDTPDLGEIVEIRRPSYSIAAKFLGASKAQPGIIFVSFAPHSSEWIHAGHWRRLPEVARHDFKPGEIISREDRTRADVRAATS